MLILDSFTELRASLARVRARGLERLSSPMATAATREATRTEARVWASPPEERLAIDREWLAELQRLLPAEVAAGRGDESAEKIRYLTGIVQLREAAEKYGWSDREIEHAIDTNGMRIDNFVYQDEVVATLVNGRALHRPSHLGYVRVVQDGFELGYWPEPGKDMNELIDAVFAPVPKSAQSESSKEADEHPSPADGFVEDRSERPRG